VLQWPGLDATIRARTPGLGFPRELSVSPHRCRNVPRHGLPAKCVDAETSVFQ